MISISKLAFLGIVAVLMQTMILPSLQVLSLSVEIAPVLVAAVAYRTGSAIGAIYGFYIGILVDLFMRTPFGLWGITLAILGYLVGIIQAGVLKSTISVKLLIGFGSALFANSFFVAGALLLGQSQFWDLRTIYTIAIGSLLSACLSPIVFPLAKRVVGEELTQVGVDDWS